MVITEGEDYDDRGSQDTERGRGNTDSNDVVDEVGGYDAFLSGMIYALSRRICPGAPYTPSAGGREDLDGAGKANDDVRARWRLDECLRFATELAGRKARRKTWDGLADEMMRAGWFDP
jgi:sugar/nucleoside kinase (ribokinase family)